MKSISTKVAHLFSSKQPNIIEQYSVLIIMKKQNEWPPLQSNPEVINKLAKQLGLKTHQFTFQELLSVEQWGQQMVQGEVLGIILLYQESPLQLEYKKKEAQKLQEANVPKGMFFMQQMDNNACGTIAIFHTILNIKQKKSEVIQKDSLFLEFFQKCEGKTPKQKGMIFQKYQEIRQKHIEAVLKGETVVKEEEVQEHFISIIEWEQCLYEIDGCKKCPVKHGQCNADSFFKKGCELVRKFMQRDPQNINFSVIVLAKSLQ